MTRISNYQAFILAKKAGAKFTRNHCDSDRQSTSALSDLAAIAKLAGYRKPKNASGSTGRYFYYYLLKKKRKYRWK